MENKLAFYREQRGMTQEELAAYVGLPAETIKEAEQTVFPLIAPSYIVKIADVLGEDANDIFPSMPKISEETIRKARQKASTLTSIEIDLEDLKSTCHICEEELRAILNTLSETRISLEVHDGGRAEYAALYTVELAMETTIRKLKEV